MTQTQIEQQGEALAKALEPITSTDNLIYDDGEWSLAVDADQDLDEIRAALPGWIVEWVGTGNTSGSGYSTEDISLRLTTHEALSARSASNRRGQEKR